MKRTLIKNARVINEGQIKELDVYIEQGLIAQLGTGLTANHANTEVIDAAGKYLMPGVIDDQVHFREPGLTHKAEIYTESRAAVAGGITSFMEMPNTVPNTLTAELLEQKYDIAAKNSLANYAFMLGASNDNIEEVLKADPKKIPALKVFLGSSTGNMLVDDEAVLEEIFRSSPLLISAHCEDEGTIKANSEKFKAEYGEDVPIRMHPVIRSAEACYLSSSKAIELAKKTGARFHVFHLSTGIETELFDNSIPLAEKKITAEVCVHHLWFDDSMYDEKGTLIKWNPAVKSATDRDALWKALIDDRIDVIATDHAPHTLIEKQNTYFKAPSGGPLVQHALVSMLEAYKQGKITLEKIVQKMCHNPAILFEIEKRGYIREGYHADLVLVDLNEEWTVSKENILYKCGWSPFEGQKFASTVTHTFVNGHLAYHNGKVIEGQPGQRLTYDR